MKFFVSIIMGMTLSQVSMASLELDREWSRISDPLIMSSTFNWQLSSLPLRGKVADAQKYWSSDYWARYKGGINYRWNSSRPTGFNLISPTKAEAAKMSLSQLASLAPSEKWDLLIGRYDYPLKTEVNNYARPDRPSWEGICDGWAGAAMNHDEPLPITLANPDGIKIPFGSSDIKALLSWYYAKKHSGGYAQMGRRCNGSDAGEDRCTHDMNAGAFHIVLSNRIGVEGKGMIADIDAQSEVWNHTTYDYRSTILQSNLAPLPTSAPGTQKMVKMRTIVNYVWLMKVNSWYPVLGTNRQIIRSRTYDYYLDLSSEGKIIGGEWISAQRPDFLWLERPVNRFAGIFSRLGELLSERPIDACDEMDGELVLE